MIITLFSFAAAEERVPVATPTGLNAQTQFFAFFVMKAAELKCPNRIVYRVCRVEHFKTFRKAHSKHIIFRRLHTDCLSLRLRLSSASPSPSAPSPLDPATLSIPCM